MHEYEAGIIRTEFRGTNTYLIDLSCESISREVVPGQFVQVRVGCGTDPFLRRTFSVCSVDGKPGMITLMVDVVGQGTEMLAVTRRSRTLNVIGPLGNGFDLHLGGDGHCILVAGGVGAAPLIFLAQELRRSTSRKITFMLGGRTARDLAIAEGMLPNGVDFMTATDDGSSGYHGYVSKLLEKKFEKLCPAAIYTCGPDPMMRLVAAHASLRKLPCQVSLEERMACGIGACYGCAVELRMGDMVRTCVDGPVFSAGEVYW